MSNTFYTALNQILLYEVGPHWNPQHPAVVNGLIDTQANRKAVGYVNDPVDPGGETKFGVAKNANPDLNITTITFDTAKKVYYNKYWLTSYSDKIADINPRLAIVHFDTAVNMGVGRANKMLQTVLGVKADGVIGPKTIEAIAQCPDVVDKYLNFRVDMYQRFVSAKPSLGRFLKGWLNRVNGLRG